MDNIQCNPSDYIDEYYIYDEYLFSIPALVIFFDEW